MISTSVDVSKVTRGMRQFTARIPRVPPTVGMQQATRTAEKVRSRVPVRTGRLRSTVTAQRIQDGGAVTYGGLPYAHYIEGRAHAVADGIKGADAEFHAAMTKGAEGVVSSL